MMGRGLFLLAILSNCALSLPVTSSQLENEDVEVMKCIVEVLADVLSRPHVMPVSKDCLVTLKTDDRLVKILRHQKFLKELQEIAVQGNHKRAQLQREHTTPTTLTQTLPTAGDIADRSMLEAFGGPGERSILSQTKRTGTGDAVEEKNDSREDGESQEDDEVEGVQSKRGNDDEAEKKEEDKESDEKRASSGEENVTKDESGDEQSDGQRQRKEKTSGEDGMEEEDKTSTLLSHIDEADTEEEVKRRSRENLKRWTKRVKSLSVKRKAASENAQQDVPHHSKELTEEDEEKKKRDSERSPEERELQWIARRAPEERKEVEEEGSASRKSEEPEIESLAAIESELENVAQKLHELRRG